jgi:hypothetical protein
LKDAAAIALRANLMGRCLGIGLTTAAVAVAALGATLTATAGASVFADDTAVQFAAGSPGGTTAVIEPGSVRLRPATEDFDGIGLPSDLTAIQWSPPYGTANAGGGALAIDGARVLDSGTYPVGEVLEFSATFSGAPAQHIGFGVTLDDGPWAIISTGSGGAVGASTRAAPGATATFDPIAVPVPNGANTFRIEWSPTEVRYYVYVGGLPQLVVTRPVSITTPMRPIMSDYTADGNPLLVDSLAMLLFPSTGVYESRVDDAGDDRTVWGTLAAAVDQPAGTAIEIDTRTGNTPTPDGSWSDYRALGAGGAIQSPSARYVQYRALLSTSDRHVTPSLLRTDLVYDIDRSGPIVVLEPARVRGHSATVRFASKALDTVGYRCSLDGAAFASCSSPRQLTGLRSGDHRISVRAIDRLDNVGPTVTNRFKVSGKDHTKPRVTVSLRSTRVSSRGAIAFRVRCPSSEERCKVTLRLKSAARVAGRATVKVKGGRAATATVHLAKAIRAGLMTHPSTRLTLVVVATDAAGNKRTTTRRITLRAPR